MNKNRYLACCFPLSVVKHKELLNLCIIWHRAGAPAANFHEIGGRMGMETSPAPATRVQRMHLLGLLKVRLGGKEQEPAKWLCEVSARYLRQAELNMYTHKHTLVSQQAQISLHMVFYLKPKLAKALLRSDPAG